MKNWVIRKSILLEEPQSHHKGKGPRPSGQAGRLRIEKQSLSEIQFLKPFIFRKKMGGISRNTEDVSPGPSRHIDGEGESVLSSERSRLQR